MFTLMPTSPVHYKHSRHKIVWSPFAPKRPALLGAPQTDQLVLSRRALKVLGRKRFG